MFLDLLPVKWKESGENENMGKRIHGEKEKNLKTKKGLEKREG